MFFIVFWSTRIIEWQKDSLQTLGLGSTLRRLISTRDSKTTSIILFVHNTSDTSRYSLKLALTLARLLALCSRHGRAYLTTIRWHCAFLPSRELLLDQSIHTLERRQGESGLVENKE